MPLSLRDVWTRALQPADYEAHMRAIGQAQANAEHIRDFIALCRPSPGDRILIAGAGTGQMFDHFPCSLFEGLRAVFSDINPEFLACLRRRYPAACCAVDDLEDTALQGPFHAACAVLVLEHIDWRSGLASLCRLAPRCLYLVVQRNPPEVASAVTPGRRLPGTMQAFAETHPQLRDPAEIERFLSDRGYRLAAERPKPAADGKTMLGLLFTPAVP